MEMPRVNARSFRPSADRPYIAQIDIETDRGDESGLIQNRARGRLLNIYLAEENGLKSLVWVVGGWRAGA